MGVRDQVAFESTAKVNATEQNGNGAQLQTDNVYCPDEKKQLKLAFETAGSWLTSSEQLPARHGLTS